MTARATFTQPQLQRAIRAARREGLRVVGIKPDGTVIVVEGGENERVPTIPEAGNADKWADVEA